MYGFSSCTSLNEWLSIFLFVFVMHIFVWMTINIILEWVFVMHNFVQMTIHILMGFRHVHLCTNDYPYYSCTGFRHVHFCTNDYPYSYGFSSCTSLYKWLSISLCMGFRHAHFCTNDYPFLLNRFLSCTFLYEWLPFLFEWVFVIHISVRMTTISFWMGFRHAHFCTNDYHFFWMGFRHAHFYTNYYLFPIYFQCVSVKRE